MLETEVLTTAEDDGVVDGPVGLAGCTTVEREGVVEEGAIVFLNGVETLDEVGVHVVEEGDVFGDVSVVLLFVGKIVGGISESESCGETVGQATFFTAELEGGDTGGVGLEGEYHQLVHYGDVFPRGGDIDI